MWSIRNPLRRRYFRLTGGDESAATGGAGLLVNAVGNSDAAPAMQIITTSSLSHSFCLSAFGTPAEGRRDHQDQRQMARKIVCHEATTVTGESTKVGYAADAENMRFACGCTLRNAG